MSKKSTISLANSIIVKTSGNCMGVGICIADGTEVAPLSFVDPGFCIEGNDCPRNFVSSSMKVNQIYYILDFQGVSAIRSIGQLGDYQRPALNET